MAKKQISNKDMVGQKGIVLIEQIVLDMGFVWYATGGLEAGIDGYIEIRDPKTGEVSNSILQVQSKANYSGLTCETDDSFVYDCNHRDLYYWLSGNAPVLLIVSKPQDRVAYWKNIKQYFSKPENKGMKRIRFSKLEDRFEATSACANAMIDSAVDKSTGLFLSPVPVNEDVYTNLLKINRYPKTIFVGDTDLKTPREVYAFFNNKGIEIPHEWFVKSSKIYTVHDLTQAPFAEAVNVDSIQSFEGEVWADSPKTEDEHNFARLLKLCLMSKLFPDVKECKNGSDEYFFVAPSLDLKPIEWEYTSIKHDTSRFVFAPYSKKSDKSQISYFRHSAFTGKFTKLERDWYLQINPTYHFTHDGYKTHKYASEMLKKIKQLEKNSAVMGQVVAWAYFLTGGETQDLFGVQYNHLTFERLLTFTLEEGIDDKAWLTKEDSDSSMLEPESDILDLPLLEKLRT